MEDLGFFQRFQDLLTRDVLARFLKSKLFLSCIGFPTKTKTSSLSNLLVHSYVWRIKDGFVPFPSECKQLQPVWELGLPILFFLLIIIGACPRGLMVKVMDCRIVEGEFVLQSCYYVHFWKKYSWERYEPPYPASSALNSIFYKDSFGIT